MLRLPLLFSSLLLVLPMAAQAKNDVVIMRNGDRLTGEVKSLSRGRLSFKTDATGTINIEWNDVARLTADHNIQVELESGLRYFGHLVDAEERFNIVVDTSTGPAGLRTENVVKMEPIDMEGLLQDIDVDVSVGYNFTKASQVTQFNVGVSADYRTRQRIASAKFSSIISDSSGNDTSRRQTLGFNYTRLRRNRWLNDGSLNFEKNDELGLDLRTTLGTGGGRILKQSNSVLLILKGGLQGTRENLVGEPEDKDSLESYVTLQWDWFRYDSPELDWSTNLQVIPSITESGRVRTEFDTTFKWEIVGDLFWRLEFYNSHDNQPQSAEGATNDYGIITSVEYDF